MKTFLLLVKTFSFFVHTIFLQKNVFLTIEKHNTSRNPCVAPVICHYFSFTHFASQIISLGGPTEPSGIRQLKIKKKFKLRSNLMFSLLTKTAMPSFSSTSSSYSSCILISRWWIIDEDQVAGIRPLKKH